MIGVGFGATSPMSFLSASTYVIGVAYKIFYNSLIALGIPFFESLEFFTMGLEMDVCDIIVTMPGMDKLQPQDCRKSRTEPYQTMPITPVSGSGKKEKVTHETNICLCKIWCAFDIPLRLYLLAALVFINLAVPIASERLQLLTLVGHPLVVQLPATP